MSREIDNKVVEMDFDNRKFEKGVSESISTLEKLKQKLNFSNSGRAFEELDAASRKVNFDSFGKAVDTVKMKFSAMEAAAFAALTNIVNRAVDAGIQFTKSVSTDQIVAGFDKYAQKTTAVQTIMAATAKDVGERWADEAEQMEYVNDVLEQMNWFTDETSYNFNDMVSNIGKFTSMDVELDRARKAMQGIALEAAISGANAQEASRAMYNFAQAIGSGVVQLIDWKSIENANMATAEFKNLLIDIAEKEGIIHKGSVTVQNFNSTLSDKWLETDRVLIPALEKYGAFSVKLGEIMNNIDGDIASSTFIRWVDEYAQNAVDFTENKLHKAAELAQMDDKALLEIIKELASEEYELGRRAMRAGQEATTFAQAIDSIKDAVSSKWSKTFELVFGDYKRAKELWTELSERLYELFAEDGTRRNNMLKEWAVQSEGGREDLIEAFWNVWDTVVGIINSIKEGFEEIFPKKTVEDITNLVLKFKELSENIALSDEASDALKRTSRGLASVLHIILESIKALIKPAIDLFSWITGSSGSILDVAASWGDAVYELDRYITKENVLFNAVQIFEDYVVGAYKKVSNAIKSFFDIPIVKSSIERIKDTVSVMWTFISGVFNKAWLALNNFWSDISHIENVEGFFKLIGEYVGKAFNKVSEFFVNMSNIAGEGLSSLWKSILNFFTNIGSNIGKYWDSFINGFLEANPAIKKAGDGIASALQYVWDQIKEKTSSFFDENVIFSKESLFAVLIGATSLFGGAKLIKLIDKNYEFFGAVGSFVNSIKGAITTIINSVQSLSASFAKIAKANAFKQTAIAIGILAAAVIALAMVGKDYNLWNAVAQIVAISGALALVVAAFAVVAKYSDEVDKVGPTMIMTALSITMIALAMTSLAKVNTDDLAKASGVILGISVLMIAITFIISKMDETNVGLNGAISMAISIFLLTASISKLTTLNLNRAERAVGEVVKLLLAMALAVFISNTKIGSNQAKGRMSAAIGMAASVLLLVFALDKLSKMDIEAIDRAMPILISLLIAMSVVMVITTLAGKNAAKAGVMFVGLTVSLLLLVGIIKMLALLSIEELKQGLVVIAVISAIFAAVMAVSQFAGKHAIQAGVMFVAMAAAIGILVGIIALIGLLDERKVLFGLGVVSVLLVLFSLLIKVSTNAEKIKMGKFIGMAVVIAMLMGIVWSLSVLKSKDAMENAIAIGVLLLAMTTSLAIINKFGSGKVNIPAFVTLGVVIALLAGFVELLSHGQGDYEKAIVSAIAIGILLYEIVGAISILGTSKTINQKKLLTIAGMCLTLIAVMYALAGLIAILSIINPENVIPNVLGLSILFIALIGAVVILGTVGKLTISLGTIASVAVMTAVMFALVGLMALLGDVEKAGLAPSTETVGKLVILLVSLIGAMVVLAVVGLFGGAAIAGVGAFSLFVLALLALMATLGELNTWIPTLEETLDKALPILERLGEGIGRFIGGIVEGFAVSVSNALPKIGENLSGFAENAKGFIDLCGNIDQDKIEAIKAFGLLFVELALANLLESLVKLFGGSVSYDEFGDNLLSFGDAYKKFANKMQNVKAIPQEVLDGIAAVTELYKTAPHMHGFIQKVIGWPDMSEMGKQLSDFGGSYVEFANALQNAKTIPDDIFDDIVNMVDLYNQVPNMDGFVQWILGQQNMSKLGDQLRSFAYSYTTFSQTIISSKHIDKNLLENISEVFDFYSDSAKFGGMKGFFEGDYDLERVGDGLLAFANGYAALLDVTKNLDPLKGGVLDVDFRTMKSDLKWFADTFKKGSDFDNLVLNSFSEGLVTFTTGYANYIDVMKTIPGYAETSVNRFHTFIEGLGSDLIIMDKMNESGNIYRFADDLVTLGEKYKNYAELVLDTDLSKMDEYGSSMKTLIEMIGEINKSTDDNILERFTGIIQKLSDGSLDEMTKLISGYESTAFETSQGIGIVFISGLVSAIRSKEGEIEFSGAIDTVVDLFGILLDSISEKIDIASDDFKMGGRSLIGSIITGAREKKDDLFNGFTAIINSIRTKYDDMKKTGEYLTQGFIDGMMSKKNDILEASIDLGTTAYEALRVCLDEHSPSKITTKIGEFFGEGFLNGITGMSDETSSAASNMGQNATDALSEALGTAYDAATSDIDISPKITPVLDLSNITSNMPKLTDVFRGSKTFNMASTIQGTLNDNLSKTVLSKIEGNKTVVDALSKLRGDIGELTSKMSNMQVVMDSGVLVGELTDPMDISLGNKMIRTRRGG